MQRRSMMLLCAAMLSGLSGCSSAGSEQAAREHYHREFRKWIAGKENEASTFRYRVSHGLPISYDLRSVTADDPDPLAKKSGSKLPENWRDWPAYRFNVVLEGKSEAGTPLEIVVTYRLTWNAAEQKWYIEERW